MLRFSLSSTLSGINHALVVLGLVVSSLMTGSRIARADTILFSTGSPDGKIATLSSPAITGKLETETADDFVLGQNALITSATITGLLVGGATPASINDVEIELYHVFSGGFHLPSRRARPDARKFPERQ